MCIRDRLLYAAAAIPPGVSEGSVKSIGYVLEGAGFEVTNIVDEPTAASAVPVSYTHLDVYQRQHLHNFHILHLVIIINRSVKFSLHKLCVHFSIQVVDLVTEGSDVYKRQAPS